MSRNPSKCKELVICKKGVDGSSFEPAAGIPKCDQLTILGMTFETNCRFSSHVKIKLPGGGLIYETDGDARRLA